VKQEKQQQQKQQKSSYPRERAFWMGVLVGVFIVVLVWQLSSMGDALSDLLYDYRMLDKNDAERMNSNDYVHRPTRQEPSTTAKQLRVEHTDGSNIEE
jgi:uncharacterized iron-regulated membrane protein